MVRLLVYLAICGTSWQCRVSTVLDSFIYIEEINRVVFVDLPLLALP